MKKIFTTIAIIIFGSGTVAGAIFYRQGVDKDTEINTHRSHIATLNNQLTELDKSRETLQEQIAETIEQLDALKNNNQYIIKLESIIEKKEAAIAGARQLTTQCTGANEVLLARIADEKKSTRSLNELLADAQGRVHALKSQIEKNRNTDAALIAELKAEYENDHKVSRKRVIRLEEKLSRTNLALAEIQDHRSRCSESKEMLETQLETNRETVRDLGDKLAQANNRVLEEKKRGQAQNDGLRAAEQKISALGGQMQKQGLAYADLKKQVAGIESQKGSVENKLYEIKSTYAGLVKELNDNIKNKEATIEECKEKLAISFIDRILFPSARISITPEGKAVLKKTGNILKNLKFGKFRIVGHTDDRPIRSRLKGRFPSNWELSSARAAAVARFFEKETGIPANRMEIVGYSHQQAISGNQTKEGRAKNRRVEIIVVPELWSSAAKLDS
jgi:chemotaxis protein MotB